MNTLFNLSPNSDAIIAMLKEMALQYGFRLVGGLLVLFIGLRIVGFLSHRFKKFIDISKVDNSLKPFLQSLVLISLRLLLFIVVLGTLGVEMSSFAALLASAGVAIGLALSGTLQNFAGGVVLLMLKPFKVGDFIQMGQESGEVTGIQVFYTYLRTGDHRVIIIPNGMVSSGTLINFSALPTRRIDLILSISYKDSIERTRSILIKLAGEHTKILNQPAPLVIVTGHGENSINLSFRVWVNTPDYWEVNFYLWEMVKTTFDKEGISIPFPQRDIRILQKTNEEK
jgi:small conductance mechanosensitive channel